MLCRESKKDEGGKSPLNVSGISIRGDSLYCPLPFNLDSYWTCEADCWHCYLRRLNEVWGKDLRPTNTEFLARKLRSGLKNNHPLSPLAMAIRKKKTFRFGNHSDPFQPAENTHHVSKRILKLLKELDWSLVIQTMFTETMMNYKELIASMDVVVQPIISPGLEKDWEMFERKRTTPVRDRMKHLMYFKNKGIQVAVNGEPFIAGYHTIKDFEDTLKFLKSFGVKRYNTYHLHFNAFIAKRLFPVLGEPIMREIQLFHSDDRKWREVLLKLIDLAKKYDFILGCPDFVNSGLYQESSNTCCGVDVSNPATWNVVEWKKRTLKGEKDILESTWDGVGDKEQGEKLYEGKLKGFYSLKDVEGMGKKKGLLF